MAGTKQGGQQAAEVNKKRYGEDYYSRIGTLGGQVKVTKGFGTNPQLAQIAGRKGGSVTKNDYRRII